MAKNSQLFFAGVLAILTSFGCGLASAQASGSASPGGLKCGTSAEDAAVYSAVLDGRGVPHDPEEAGWRKEPMVNDETIPAKEAHWPKRPPRDPRYAPEVPLPGSFSDVASSDETLADFNSKRNQTCPLPVLAPSISYRLLSEKDLSGIFHSGRDPFKAWVEFYKKYPGASGYWSFSSVGYNSGKNEALLYVAHPCGALCGTGDLYLLGKEAGTWRVKNRLMLWIS